MRYFGGNDSARSLQIDDEMQQPDENRKTKKSRINIKNNKKLTNSLSVFNVQPAVKMLMNTFRAPEQNKTYCNMIIYENGERSKAAQIPNNLTA